MESAKPRGDRRRFYFAAFLLALVAVVLSALAAVYMTVFQNAQNSSRGRDLDAAIKLKEQNSESGNAAIEKVFVDARAEKLAAGPMMMLYRQYAGALYANDEIAEGDAIADKGIALITGDPPADSLEADVLTHLYQDKGGAHYHAFVKNRSLDSGAKDQEKSLAVAEKAFGPDHQQTIYKAPTLALIYADTGRTDDAEKIMKRCLDSIASKESGRPAAWFVYATLAHMRAIQHKYPEAVKAFTDSCNSTNDQAHKERAWEELEVGLKQSQPLNSDGWKTAQKLLKKGKFDELEQMLTACLASKKSEGMGDWLLDEYYWGLDGGYNNSDEQKFAQTTADIKKWIAHNPNSVFARTALAHACIFSYWAMRNSSKPSKESNRLMADRLKLAREMLNAAPDVKKKNPSACSAEARLLLVEGQDKSAMKKVADDCHKSFPTYMVIDFWVAKFLSGRWLGTDEEADKYIVARAAQFGSSKGDEAYTQIYHYEASTQQNTLELPDLKSPEWKRMKAGYQRIFVDYPNDMDARLQAISDSIRCGDTDFPAHVFDDKKR